MLEDQLVHSIVNDISFRQRFAKIASGHKFTASHDSPQRDQQANAKRLTRICACGEHRSRRSQRSFTRPNTAHRLRSRAFVTRAFTRCLNLGACSKIFQSENQVTLIQGGIMKYKALICAVALLLVPLTFARASDENAKDEKERLHNAGIVMDEILNIPDDIPQDLLDKARCVVLMPSVLKAAFVVGGSYGRGTMVCRTGKDFTGPWGPPAMYALEGGSVGLQIGGEATDFVILVMNNRGV